MVLQNTIQTEAFQTQSYLGVVTAARVESATSDHFQNKFDIQKQLRTPMASLANKNAATFSPNYGNGPTQDATPLNESRLYEFAGEVGLETQLFEAVNSKLKFMKMEKLDVGDRRITLNECGSGLSSQRSHGSESAHMNQNEEVSSLQHSKDNDQSDVSETSSLQDAEMLLENEIDMRVVDTTKSKRKTWGQMKVGNSNGPDNYQWALERLKDGIQAQKFNFTNLVRKKIQLKLSQSGTSLNYTNQDKDFLWGILKGSTSIKISGITGLLYGGQSMTFRLHKKALFKKLKRKQAYERSILSRFNGQKKEFKTVRIVKCPEQANSSSEESEEEEDEQIFYSWQCISLLRNDGSTFDLVIQDQNDLLALVHVIHRSIYDQKGQEFLRIYKILRFKMKLAYESWVRGLKLSELIHRAVFKTVVQQYTVAAFNLSRFLTRRYNSQHGLYKSKLLRAQTIAFPGDISNRCQSLLSLQFKKDIVASHIRMFTAGLRDGEIRQFADCQTMNKSDHTPLTYGHAMYEFSFWRKQTREFLLKFHRWQIHEKLGLLNAVNNAINEIQEYSPTASFYHQSQDSKTKRTLRKMLVKMIQEEQVIKQKLNGKQSKEDDQRAATDFNEWILGGSSDQSIYSDERELAKNLLLLQKHSLIDVKMCKLNLCGLKDPENIDKVAKAINSAQRDLQENKKLIKNTQDQAKEATKKKQQSKMVWFTRKIKFIIAESDRKMSQFESNADILTSNTNAMQQVLYRRQQTRIKARDKLLLAPKARSLKHRKRQDNLRKEPKKKVETEVCLRDLDKFFKPIERNNKKI